MAPRPTSPSVFRLAMQIASSPPEPTTPPSTPFLDRTARRLQLPRARLVRTTTAILGLLQRHAATADLFRLRAQLPEFGMLMAPSLLPGRPRRHRHRWLQVARRWLDARSTRDCIEHSELGAFALAFLSELFDHLRLRLGAEVTERVLASVPGLQAYRSWPPPRSELPRADGPGHREIA